MALSTTSGATLASSKGIVVPKVRTGLVRYNVDLLRVASSSRSKVLAQLNALNAELLSRLSDENVTDFSKARLNAFLKQTTGTIEDYYARISGIQEKALGSAARTSADNAATQLDRAYAAVELDAALPPEQFLERMAGSTVVDGAVTEDWWARQSRDTAFRFAQEVRQGLVAGDTQAEIAARVAGRHGYPGIMETSRRNAVSLVHMSLQEVASTARRETFKRNDDVVEGIMQVSTLDDRTTDICMAYDGASWNLDEEPIDGNDLPYDGGVPRHWGCRSVEVPITTSFKDLGIDAPEPGDGTRASDEGPVPGDYTFSDFLDDHTLAEQDEMLGEGRAQLYRDGKITLRDLLDQNGNPLTLAELERKYG